MLTLSHMIRPPWYWAMGSKIPLCEKICTKKQILCGTHLDDFSIREHVPICWPVAQTGPMHVKYMKPLRTYTTDSTAS